MSMVYQKKLKIILLFKMKSLLKFLRFALTNWLAACLRASIKNVIWWWIIRGLIRIIEASARQLNPCISGSN